jgi:mercuric ion binding protein
MTERPTVHLLAPRIEQPIEPPLSRRMKHRMARPIIGPIARASVLLILAGSALGAQRQVTLTVPTMDCATCPVTIRVALLKVPGVTRAVVSYAHRDAKVTFDDAKTTPAELTRATDAAGYPSFVADAK